MQEINQCFNPCKTQRFNTTLSLLYSCLFEYSLSIVRFLPCLLHKLCQISDLLRPIGIMYFLLFIVLVPIIVAVACRFVQKTTVRIEELEIDYEQNCMKDVPIPFTPFFFSVTIWSTTPSLSERNVVFERLLKKRSK